MSKRRWNLGSPEMATFGFEKFFFFYRKTQVLQLKCKAKKSDFFFLCANRKYEPTVFFYAAFDFPSVICDAFSLQARKKHILSNTLAFFRRCKKDICTGEMLQLPVKAAFWFRNVILQSIDSPIKCSIPALTFCQGRAALLEPLPAVTV